MASHDKSTAGGRSVCDHLAIGRILSLVRLPGGVIDPARDQPLDDMAVLAPTAGLVVRDGIPPLGRAGAARPACRATMMQTLSNP